MQKDKPDVPANPYPEPIPDPRQDDFWAPKPGEDLDPPSGDPRRDN